MQVYKAFFKIILKNLNQIMIYVAVFISLTVTLANTNAKTINTDFSETKVNMAFINNDTNSGLVEGLKNHISKNAKIIDIPDDAEKLQDALFFRDVEYIVRVPKGFSEGLLKGEVIKLEKTSVPGSTSSIFLDSIIYKYLNTAKTYTSSMKNISEEQLLSYINMDMEQNTEVKFKTSAEEVSNNEKRAYYFNYMAYSLFSVLILGVCSVMIVFNNPDLRKRNHCSPVKLNSINFQLILGNLSYAVIAWFAMVVTGFIMYGSYMFTGRGLLFLLNSFIFTLAALSISFLIGNVIKSRNAMSAAANVFSLGTCFISGVFVPQAFLGKTVLRIASFTPNYWYVKSNNSIVNLANFNMENLTPIFFNMLIVLGFAVAVLAMALVVIKQKRVSN
jgi:ABC-2 type transport system permease protein